MGLSLDGKNLEVKTTGLLHATLKNIFLFLQAYFLYYKKITC